MFTTQKGNVAEGDVVAGDKVETHFHIQPSALSRLYEKLRNPTGVTATDSAISEQLRHFCSVISDGDVRGLEKKLSDAGREDLLQMASHLKEVATKLVMKWQTSHIAQDILTLILASIYTDYVLNVQPAIQDGRTRAEVDSLISEKVIKPATVLLGENDLMLTAQDLLGLVFFLAGNCHIRWDKC